MIFPSLKNKNFGYINLDIESQKWLEGKKFGQDKNPLLDPAICREMVNDVNAKYKLDFSYGGWMEDRSAMLKGSYLDKRNTHIHLGIDFNVPDGTEIASAFDSRVAKIDDDYPDEYGWGTRIILKHQAYPIYLIYAHLDREIGCKVGDILKKDKLFSKVGKPPYNGNWWPHLHLQIIAEEYYHKLERKNSWKELDGYGAEREIGYNARTFPDPTKFVF